MNSIRSGSASRSCALLWIERPGKPTPSYSPRTARASTMTILERPESPCQLARTWQETNSLSTKDLTSHIANLPTCQLQPGQAIVGELQRKNTFSWIGAFSDAPRGVIPDAGRQVRQ